MLVEVSQSHPKKRQRSSRHSKWSAVRNCLGTPRAWRRRLHRSHTGRRTTGDNLVAPALDSVSPQTAGFQNRRERFRDLSIVRDRRSRNVLDHRPSAKRITSPTVRRVRAETIRCRTTTLVKPVKPNGNSLAQTSRNLGSERTSSRWSGILPKAPMSAVSSGRVSRLRDDVLSRNDNLLWIRVADSEHLGPTRTMLKGSR